MAFSICRLSDNLAKLPRYVEDKAKFPVPTEKIPKISRYPSQFHLQEFNPSFGVIKNIEFL